MAALATALHHQREAELTRNEQAIVAAWKGDLPSGTDVNGRMIAPFVTFCMERKVRYCPANPYVVAAYLRWLMDMNVGGIPDLLRGIEEVHAVNGLANPVQTFPVRELLSELASKEPPGPPPRSWPKADQLLWAELPPAIRAVISKRDRERETALRRMQNELAEMKKRLNGSSVPKAVDNKEDEVMAKEGKGFTKADEEAAGLVDGGPAVGAGDASNSPYGKDISRRVNDAADENGGYAGKVSGNK